MDAFLKQGPKKAQSTKQAELAPLKSEDPSVSAFYAQLTEPERIAHAIAVEKLGTSYDVTRTHGYLKWVKTYK